MFNYLFLIGWFIRSNKSFDHVFELENLQTFINKFVLFIYFLVKLKQDLGNLRHPKIKQSLVNNELTFG